MKKNTTENDKKSFLIQENKWKEFSNNKCRKVSMGFVFLWFMLRNKLIKSLVGDKKSLKTYLYRTKYIIIKILNTKWGIVREFAYFMRLTYKIFVLGSMLYV